MKSFAPAVFWGHYDRIPVQIQELANKNFEVFNRNPFHPSLHFKEVAAGIWSARIGSHYSLSGQTAWGRLDVVLDRHPRGLQQTR